MRLDIKEKSSKKKSAKNTSKQKDKSKSSTKYKKRVTLVDYRSKEEYPNIRDTIEFSKLTYGIIKYHKLKSIVLSAEEEIKLEGSWIEGIVLMLSMAHSIYKEDFKKKLGDYGITGSEVSVDKRYGIVTFDSSKKYKVYSIYNTDYYIEAIFTESNIYNILRGLVVLLKLNTEDREIKLFIEKEKAINPRLDTYNIEEWNEVDTLETIHNLKANYTNYHLVSVDIKGEVVEVHTIESLLYIILNNRTPEELEKLEMIKANTYIIKEEETEFNAKEMMRIGNTGYVLVRSEDIVDYAIKVISELQLDIRIKFEKSRATNSLKEWEIG